MKQKHDQSEIVLLVHGFLSKRLLMKPLQWQIARYGFRTESWGYASFMGSLKRHANRLQPKLEELVANHQTVHVVAHSMGTIVFRLALQQALRNAPLNNLGRIVLMAPPNQGTPTARLINPLFCLFCKGVSELSDHPDALVHEIETPEDLELGTMSGKFDWIVPRSRTHLAGQSDHICLTSTHNSMLVQPNATQYIVEFLRTGKFMNNRQAA